MDTSSTTSKSIPKSKAKIWPPLKDDSGEIECSNSSSSSNHISQDNDSQRDERNLNDDVPEDEDRFDVKKNIKFLQNKIKAAETTMGGSGKPPANIISDAKSKKKIVYKTEIPNVVHDRDDKVPGKKKTYEKVLNDEIAGDNNVENQQILKEKFTPINRFKLLYDKNDSNKNDKVILDKLPKLKNGADNIFKPKNDEDNCLKLKNDADNFPKLNNDADKLPNLNNDADKLSNLKNDADKLPNLNNDADKLSNLKNDADKLPNFNNDADKLSNLENDADKLSNLKNDADKLPNLNNDVDKLSNLKNDADKLSNLKNDADKLLNLNNDSDKLSNLKNDADANSNKNIKGNRIEESINDVDQNSNCFEQKIKIENEKKISKNFEINSIPDIKVDQNKKETVESSKIDVENSVTQPIQDSSSIDNIVVENSELKPTKLKLLFQHKIDKEVANKSENNKKAIIALPKLSKNCLSIVDKDISLKEMKGDEVCKREDYDSSLQPSNYSCQTNNIIVKVLGNDNLSDLVDTSKITEEAINVLQNNVLDKNNERHVVYKSKAHDISSNKSTDDTILPVPLNETVKVNNEPNNAELISNDDNVMISDNIPLDQDKILALFEKSNDKNINEILHICFKRINELEHMVALLQKEEESCKVNTGHNPSEIILGKLSKTVTANRDSFQNASQKSETEIKRSKIFANEVKDEGKEEQNDFSMLMLKTRLMSPSLNAYSRITETDICLSEQSSVKCSNEMGDKILSTIPEHEVKHSVKNTIVEDNSLILESKFSPLPALPLSGMCMLPPPPPPPPPPCLPSPDLPSSQIQSPQPTSGGYNYSRLQLNKPVINPKYPMKQLFWRRIIIPQRDSQGENKNLWMEISELEIPNIEEFAELFTQKLTRSQSMRCITRRTICNNPIKLLDDKRSQNVAIFQRSLINKNISISSITKALYNLDVSIVSAELLKQVHELRPTTEELQKIKKYVEENPNKHQDNPEMFLFKLHKIHMFDERVRCITFRERFPNVIQGIQNSLDIVLDVCKFLLTNKNLKKIFSIILTLGNYMNGGNTTRGQADGFDLDILPKLIGIQSSDSSISLLRFVIQSYVKQCRDPAKAQYPLPELSDVSRASIIKFDYIEEELKALEMEYKNITDTLPRLFDQISAKNVLNDDENVQLTQETLKSFLKQVGMQISFELKHLYECKKEFEKTVQYYVFKSTNNATGDSTEAFFELWLAFCSSFNEIWQSEYQKNRRMSHSQIRPIENEKKKEGGLKSKVQKVKRSHTFHVHN